MSKKWCVNFAFNLLLHAYQLTPDLDFWWDTAGRVTARESTLGSRPLPQKEFQTPAPGEYDIDRIDKSKLQTGGCIRGYTFGHPNIHSRPSRLPGKTPNLPYRNMKQDLFSFCMLDQFELH